MIVRGCNISRNQPLICVPIVGATIGDMIQMIDGLDDYDLLELRLDYLNDLDDLRLLKQIRDCVDCPIIGTLRTVNEGGYADVSIEDYILFIEMICEFVDIVDIELSMGKINVFQLVEFVHQKGCLALVSHHDFNLTPAYQVILDTFDQMEVLGGDILKVAYMPFSSRDVVTLMNAMLMVSSKIDKPLIGISMGELGRITRVCAKYLGSCITFASACQDVAPGQLSVSDMRVLMEVLNHD